MKKLVLAVATACAVAVAAVGVAFAGGGGKVVAEEFACGVLDGNGNAFITYDSVLTVYQNKAVLQCEGWGAPARSLTYFNYDNTGFSCGMLDFGSTLNWVDKVGYRGNSQLTCTQYANGDDSVSSAGAGIG